MAAISSLDPIKVLGHSSDVQYKFSGESIRLLRGAVDAAISLIQKNAVFLLGMTGSGKSTIVNHLLGLSIVYNRSLRRFEVDLGETEIAKIGHKKLISETVFLTPYMIEGKIYYVVDGGGLLDSRGVNLDIAISTCYKLALENAESVRLLLCFECEAIFTDRCQQLIRFLDTALRSLLSCYEDHPQSIGLLFTKPPVKEDGTRFDRNDALEALVAIEESLEEGETKRLFEFLLREEGKYISVHDPRSDDSRVSTLALIDSMSGIVGTKTAFRTFYTMHSKLVLMEALTAISTLGIEIYSGYFQNMEFLENERFRLQNIQKLMEEKIEFISKTFDNAADLESIQEHLEKELEKKRTIIEQEENSIAENTRIKNLVLNQLEELSSKIVAWEIDAEQVDLYWEDGINEKGVIYQQQTVSTETRSKNWYGRVKKKRSSKIVNTPIPRVIPRDFIYSGPPIEKIEKEPADLQLWSNEILSEDRKSFSVHFESSMGQDAIARVKIYVRRESRPDHIEVLRGFEDDKLKLLERLNRIEASIRQHAAIKTIAERSLNTQVEKMSSLENHQNELENYENIKRNLEQQVDRLSHTICEFQGRVRDNSHQFELLKDFLFITRDDLLASAESISRFLAFDARYRREVIDV